MNPAKENLLVTGCAGFIGYHLTATLLKNRIPVVGIDNFDPFYPRVIKEQNLADLRQIAIATETPFQFWEKDINRLSVTEMEAMALVGVIHLAAKAGVRPSLEDPESYFRVNVDGTLHLLKTCRQLKVLRFVLGSSSSVYGNTGHGPFVETLTCDKPISPYAASKRAAELLCYTYAHLYGFAIAAPRLFTVYGPRQRPDLAIHKFAKLIWSENPIELFGKGTTARDYTHVSDIVSGLIAAWHWTHHKKNIFEVFNLGNSSPITLIDLVRLMEEKLGKKASVTWKSMQPGDVEKTWSDISKSRAILGYQPAVSLDQGMIEFAAWFKESQKISPSLPEGLSTRPSKVAA